MAHKEKTTPRRDLYADITNQLIEAIERNPGQFQLPWHNAGGGLQLPVNALTGKPYNGINIVSLWVTAEIKHHAAPIWGTYKQWAELGAQVRKGERAATVIFYREFEAEPNPEQADDDGKRRVARASAVFNADQVDGFDLPPQPEMLGPVERIAAADIFAEQTGASIRHGGPMAYYQPSTDHIQMPDEGRFTGTEGMTRDQGYYATLVHELVHWSGAKDRLARDMGRRFGDAAYAAEELVAEIGSAFLCAELGITQDVRPDHAQYLGQWLKLMKADPKAIFTAAARASEAASYLRSLGKGPKG